MKRLGFTAIVLSLGIGLAVMFLMDAGPSAAAHEVGDLILTASGIDPASMPLFSTTATDVAGGADHSCAVTSWGNVRCWGRNDYGQLGNGTTSDSTIPVTVTNTGGSPLAGIANVAAGYFHTCAVTTGGGVKCWGKNNYGQLGNGEHGDDLYDTNPVDVSGLSSGTTAMAAGYEHTCALVDGGVECWGSNHTLQMGNNQYGGSQDTPGDVYGLGSGSGETSIAAGSAHTCAVTADGRVQCWGL